MARIVAVHGIAQQREGAHSLHAKWLPALRDGLALAGATTLPENDLTVAFYGAIFRPKGKGLHAPATAASDWEIELLRTWCQGAIELEPGIAGAGESGKARTPGALQAMLRVLSKSSYFSKLSAHVMLGDLRQVHAYLHDDGVREHAQQRLAEAVQPDTRVLVAHSLGSVVAYEYLCAHLEAGIRTLVTLGSPLGIRNLIFERLRPAPDAGHGAWPGATRCWVNVADRGDVVALVKNLRPLFGERLEDRLVNNGAKAHSVLPYLTAVETGRAVLAGLAD